MTEKQLKNLKREELLELLVEEAKKNEELQAKLGDTDSSENEKAVEATDAEKELKRVRYKKKYIQTVKNTIFTLITVAAVSVLVATLWMPVLRIYGTSMTPTLDDGSIVVSFKTDDYKTGDVIAFYYNNKILVKRVIAQAGQWVDIDKNGVVTVNGEIIDEPYVDELSFGDCDIPLPYQVPEERVFVMGDHRDVSIDSRNTSVGCVAEEQVVGIIKYKVWPLDKASKVR